MERPRLYLDEDVHADVSSGLRRRGFDVITTLEAKLLGASDEEQLRFATAAGRSLFTFNRGDFVQLHARTLAQGGHHFGVILSRQVTVGTAVRMLSVLLSTRTATELRDSLVWLGPRSLTPPP